MLEIINPFSLVLGSIEVFIRAIATSFIILPISLVDISINMYELSYLIINLPLPLALPFVQSP